MNAELPQISVIIPHLNQPEHLRRCLASLAAQNYPRERFEVIAVDNGSAEPPTAALDELPGVRLEQEPTPGPGPARNRGVALARGEILAFIDADCTADPGWLAAVAGRFHSAVPRLILGGDVRIAYRDPNRLTALEAYESVFAYRQQEYITKKGFSGTGNLAVRRADFAAIGPFAGIEVAEDREWGHRAVAKGYRIAYVPEMIVFHPARETFAELCTKWDRHIDHGYNEWRRDGRGRAAWCLRAAAVAASSVVDIRRIIANTRLSGLRPRALAAIALFRIRWWRAMRMVSVMTFQLATTSARSWNR
jgi:glycosyltransferase involved in cell wall biosynthesis